MKPIERIAMYLQLRGISPHAFEKKIELSNGYYSKQLRNLGSVGSDILIKINTAYAELNISWILTGEGPMLSVDQMQEEQLPNSMVDEFTQKYEFENRKLKNLEVDVENLSTILKDKEKIIGLYEFMLNANPPGGQARTTYSTNRYKE